MDNNVKDANRKFLLQVYTGEGKGKTTAAVGLALRACGAGYHVKFVQFIKGGQESSELKLLRQVGVEVFRPERETTSLLRKCIDQASIKDAQNTWEHALQFLTHAATSLEHPHMLILDEINNAFFHKLLDVHACLPLLLQGLEKCEIICTGRNAHPLLVDAAHYVMDIANLKHPWQQGISARKGIEY